VSAEAERHVVRQGRPEAAAVVWCRERMDPKRARLGGILRALVGGGLAALLYFVFAQTVLAVVAATVASLTLVLACVSPLGAYAAVEGWLQRLARLVGTVLAWVLLGLAWLLFVAPYGLLMRRGARDALSRRIDEDAPSYWRARDEAPDLTHPY